MGMSNWILDNEDKFWDKVYDKITESEHISEAMNFAVELGKKRSSTLRHLYH